MNSISSSVEPNDKRERELMLLIDRLPARPKSWIIWLRRPASRRVRIPAAGILIAGGLLSFLPILGLWMLPLGLALLAEDVPMLRRTRNRVLDRLSERRARSAAKRQ